MVLTSKSLDPTITHIVHIMCKFLNKLLFLYRKSYRILIYTALTAFRPNPTRLAYPRSHPDLSSTCTPTGQGGFLFPYTHTHTHRLSPKSHPLLQSSPLGYWYPNLSVGKSIQTLMPGFIFLAGPRRFIRQRNNPKCDQGRSTLEVRMSHPHQI